MMKYHYRLIFLCCTWLCACQENVPEGPLPTIAWEETSGRFRIATGEALTLVPLIGNTDKQTTYTWTQADEIVCKDSIYTFCSPTAGTYFIALHVSNAFGTASDEIKITVNQRNEEADNPQLPANDSLFRWYFPQTEYNISKGRSVRIRPYLIENGEGMTYVWTLDGTAVEDTADCQSYVFNAVEEGTYQLQLTAQKDTIVHIKNFRLTICPPEGTFRRKRQPNSSAEVNRIHAYRPAPGFMVNGYKLIGRTFPLGCTHEEACDTVLSHLRNRWMISLGGWGGYLIAGFDHSITNTGGDYEICIKGNPFNYQSEPGIIWVSQDSNGDGQPNDVWYELAGSEYGSENHKTEYAVTYYRPSQSYSATIWKDCHGNSDIIPYMSYWNPEPSYWQEWMEGDRYTFCGSWLKSHHTYQNGIAHLPPYAWGYADNDGNDMVQTTEGKAGVYKISNARNWDGTPIHLEYIDFVKVQTAQTGYTPNLGEISTEIYFIGDYQMMQ